MLLRLIDWVSLLTANQQSQKIKKKGESVIELAEGENEIGDIEH